MPLLPDLATSGVLALVVFLLALGVLVVFVETVPRRTTVVLLLTAFLLAALFAGLGEVGISLVVLGFAAALLGNSAFEWLTTR